MSIIVKWVASLRDRETHDLVDSIIIHATDEKSDALLAAQEEFFARHKDIRFLGECCIQVERLH